MLRKSVEQKLHEAYCKGTGVQLDIDHVRELLGPGDAIRTRITNYACKEVGVDEVGCDEVLLGESWESFKERLLEQE